MKKQQTEKQAVIDIGNTFTKIGIFQHHNLIEYYERVKLNEVAELLEHEKVKATIVGNVGKNIHHYIDTWKSVCPIVEVSSHLRLPFTNLYQTPETLGADRIALVVGAKKIFPSNPCLCIDVGSCITFDFITADNQYKGGSIAPGIRMRLRAMHEHTAVLPLISEIQKVDIIGNSTVSCMLSGAVNGIIAEIKCFSDKYLQMYPDTKILITGGDVPLISSELPVYIVTNAHLVLIGLHVLLTENL